METAFIQTELKPYLFKTNRYDLVEKTISINHQHCRSKEADKNLEAHILDQLLFAGDGTDNFVHFQKTLCDPARPEALIIVEAFESLYEKVQSFETHAIRSQQVLANKDTHISNMETHIAELKSHINDVEAHAKNLERALTDKDTHISNMENEIRALQTRIAAVEKTFVWRLMRKWCRFNQFLTGSK
jgi:DNA gyrase/topoisomerase IV subunit A